MPPESILECNGSEGKNKYRLSTSADIWSLGCILHQIVFGSTPFTSLNMVQKISMITNNSLRIPIKEHNNQYINDIILNCIQREPNKRYSLDTLINHSFLNYDNEINRLNNDNKHKIN